MSVCPYPCGVCGKIGHRVNACPHLQVTATQWRQILKQPGAGMPSYEVKVLRDEIEFLRDQIRSLEPQPWWTHIIGGQPTAEELIRDPQYWAEPDVDDGLEGSRAEPERTTTAGWTSTRRAAQRAVAAYESAWSAHPSSTSGYRAENSWSGTPIETGWHQEEDLDSMRDVGALDDDLAKLQDMVGEVQRIMKRAEGPSDETALGAMNPSPKQPNILRFGIDSGACATVIPADWHTEYATEDVGNAKSYRAASGDFIKDEGLSKLHVDTMSDRFRTVKVRRAKVTKPLMAVSSILDAGGSVTFTPQRSWITDARGHEENLERRQNVFNLAVKVRAPSPPK